MRSIYGALARKSAMPGSGLWEGLDRIFLIFSFFLIKQKEQIKKSVKRVKPVGLGFSAQTASKHGLAHANPPIALLHSNP
jgi:hypothetical protein